MQKLQVPLTGIFYIRMCGGRNPIMHTFIEFGKEVSCKRESP